MNLEPTSFLCSLVVIAALSFPAAFIVATALIINIKVKKKATAILVFLTGIAASLISTPLININAASCYKDAADEYFLPLSFAMSAFMALLAISGTKIFSVLMEKLRG